MSSEENVGCQRLGENNEELLFSGYRGLSAQGKFYRQAVLR